MQIHASCVARDDEGGRRGVLLLGPSGSGKSDLALRLIETGFTLIADDRVTIAAGVASSPPPLRGLLEVRGLGVIQMPFWDQAPLALVLRLQRDVARLPEPRIDPLLGLPVLAIDAARPSAPSIVRLGLDCLHDRRRCQVGAFA